MRRKLGMTSGGHEASQVSRPRLALFLELPEPPVVGLHLLPQLGVLDHRVLVVKLQTPHPVQPLEVKPTFPSDANTIEDKRSF